MFADVYMLCVCSRSVYNKQGNYKCLQILLTGSTLHTHTHTLMGTSGVRNMLRRTYISEYRRRYTNKHIICIATMMIHLKLYAYAIEKLTRV